MLAHYFSVCLHVFGYIFAILLFDVRKCGLSSKRTFHIGSCKLSIITEDKAQQSDYVTGYG